MSLENKCFSGFFLFPVAFLVYGVEVVKSVKTFLATHPTFGGAIRVVIVKEKNGLQFFYCTDPEASAREIIETFADRAAIEQVFHDVKEVWGSGQQQVRNLWANIAAWRRSKRQLVHRDDSPWDRDNRRPSHADRHKALQAACLRNELLRTLPTKPLSRKFRLLLGRLLRIAV